MTDLDCDQIVGTSPQTRALRHFIRESANHEAPLLILGEPGVGKEVVARGIHSDSCRASEPFLMIDCSLYYERELKREIFGYQGGGPEGKSRRGILEFATTGTCYLTRVEELTVDLQQELLRFLSTGKFRRLGDKREMSSSARLILSSEKNIQGFVDGGLFDADLFELLADNQTRVAPLRERPGDVNEIVDSIISEQGCSAGLDGSFSSECLEALRAFPWPRNSLELEKEIRRLVQSGVVPARVEDLSFEIASFWRGQCDDPEVRKVVEELDGYIREFRVLSRLDAEFGDMLDDVIEWGGIGGGRKKKKPKID